MDSRSIRPDKWFVCPQANPRAELRLFLFPYAGGGAAVFNKWTSGLSDILEARVAHYPGRGSRHGEAPIRQISVLVEHLLAAIRPLRDTPFAFFGHSLGGLAAFELAHHLRRNGLPGPQVLFVSACAAPHLPDPQPPLHALPDCQFLESVRRLNGIPAELPDQPEIMQMLLPVLRADFEALESYVYSPAEPPLECPIVAFGGLDDPRVSRGRLEGWSLHTNSGFHSQYFPGDHFFIQTAREALIAAISARLTSIHAKN